MDPDSDARDALAESLWFEDMDDSAAERAARRSKAARVARRRGLLTFRRVARTLVAAVSRPNYELESVVPLLEEDPALACNLLRLANAGQREGEAGAASVEDAARRVGSEALRNMLLSSALAGAFWKSRPAKLVRDHCACTASLARLLAREFAPGYTAPAYLAGLLHDTGKLFLLQSGSARYAHLLARQADRIDGMHLTERELLGYDHAVLAAAILEHWRIPAPVPQVVRWHHRPAQSRSQEHLGRLVAVLRLADALERLIRFEPSAFEQRLPALATSGDAQYLGLELGLLRKLWNPMYMTWNDSQRLLG